MARKLCSKRLWKRYGIIGAPFNLALAKIP